MQSASASGQVAVVPYFPSGCLSFVSLSGGRRAAATLVRCCQPAAAALLIGQRQAAGVYKVSGEPMPRLGGRPSSGIASLSGSRSRGTTGVRGPTDPSAARPLQAWPPSCPYRKSDPNVLVMQSAEMRLCEDPSDDLNFPRHGCVLVQRQMRAALVVMCHVG